MKHPTRCTIECVKVLLLQLKTRQLLMGAGYCQWGGLTDRNGCGSRARKEGRKARKYIRICNYNRPEKSKV